MVKWPSWKWSLCACLAALLAMPLGYQAMPLTHSSTSVTAHLLEHHLSRQYVRKTISQVLTSVFTHWHALLLLPALLATFLKSYEFLRSFLRSLPRSYKTFVWAIQTGLGYRWLRKYHLDHSSEEFQSALISFHTEVGKKLTELCRFNGGIYVKAGQFASSFPAVAQEIRAQLSTLEDRAVPRPYKEIRQVMLAELGPDAESLFSNFEEKATAAASIAQVHRARLSTGKEVAVKLQYPDLKDVVKADLFVMKWLTRSQGCRPSRPVSHEVEYKVSRLSAKPACQS
eukprot:gene8831-73_t